MRAFNFMRQKFPELALTFLSSEASVVDHHIVEMFSVVTIPDFNFFFLL